MPSPRTVAPTPSPPPRMPPRRGLRNIAPVSTGPLRLGSDGSLFFDQIMRLLVDDMRMHSMKFIEQCEKAASGGVSPVPPVHIVDGSNLFYADDGGVYRNLINWGSRGPGKKFFTINATSTDLSGPVVVVMKKDNWTDGDFVPASLGRGGKRK